MKPFKSHRGVLAPLDRSNIDTDQIIAKQFLKSISRTGFGPQLFYDWRYKSDGTPDASFSLNQPRYKNASILVAGNNFGCGSSREHAVWAIQQYGFAVVVAPWRKTIEDKIPAFADIFRNNSFKNALLTIELNADEVKKILEYIERFPGLEATANLEEQRVTLHLDETEESFHFEIDPAIKEKLVHGLDDIAQTLKHESELKAFEARHDAQLHRG